MKQIESNLFVHDCVLEQYSLSLTEEIQEELLGVVIIDHSTDYLPEIVIEPSYFENSCDFTSSLSANNEYECVSDNILCLDFPIDKNKNVV